LAKKHITFDSSIRIRTQALLMQIKL